MLTRHYIMLAAAALLLSWSAPLNCAPYSFLRTQAARHRTLSRARAKRNDIIFEEEHIFVFDALPPG
jgi:hypothetical protein